MSIDTQTERAPEDKPFILVREDRDPSLSYYFSSYLESAESCVLEHNGCEYVALRLFEPTARKNALWQGWTCITEEFYKPKSEAATEYKDEEVVIKIDTKAKKAPAKRSTRRKK